MSTIEEIERRSLEIEQAERDAMRRLAAYLRELALELPSESTMPIRLAKAAGSIDTFARSTSPGLWGCSTIDNAISEYGREAVENYAAKLMGALGRPTNDPPEDR